MATGSDAVIESIPVKPESAAIAPSDASCSTRTVIDPTFEVISEDATPAVSRSACSAAAHASSGEHSTVKVTS